jgi:hypothetical protein
VHKYNIVTVQKGRLSSCISFPVERAARGSCDLSVLHIAGNGNGWSGRMAATWRKGPPPQVTMRGGRPKPWRSSLADAGASQFRKIPLAGAALPVQPSTESPAKMGISLFPQYKRRLRASQSPVIPSPNTSVSNPGGSGTADSVGSERACWLTTKLTPSWSGFKV